MLIDITLQVTPNMTLDAQGNEKKALLGHLGTHFDVMNKEFPLAYTERNAILFDVSHIQDRDIELFDIAIEKVQPSMFVAFYSNYMSIAEYGTKTYFSHHPQLSIALLEHLISLDISIIGIDFAGVRRGVEHTPMDQHCADHGVFIIENLCHLDQILANNTTTFTACTYPMNFSDMTGLPCRVIAKLP